MKITSKIGAVFGVAALALLSPIAAHAGTPQARVVELRDECEKASWDVEFPGLCEFDAGSVSLPEFREELADGGDGAWWIRQRALTLDKGDTIASANTGGIIHTFTEVAKYGKGCVPEWNTAITSTVDNCDFPKFVSTLVSPGDTSAPQTLSVGVHRFQCLIHPWMRSTVTVKAP